MSVILRLVGRRSIATKLIRDGIKTKRDLMRPEVLSRLPRDIRASLQYSPVTASYETASKIASYVRRHIRLPNAEIIPVGGVRRRRPRVKDIDFLVVSPGDVLSDIQSPLIVETYAMGPRRRSCIFRYGGKHYKLDFFIASPESRPFALYHHTGSAQYNIRIRAHVKRLGWKLNQYGIFDSKHRRVAGSESIKTERDLANFLGITYRSPESRE